MEYAQLNESGTDALQITSHGPIEWDAQNYCTAAALVKDGKAEQFRVVELLETQPPEIDPAAQTVFRDGCELIDGLWQYKWTVRDLTPEEITERRKLNVPQVLTIRQARRVLLAEGLLDDVEYAVQQAPHEVQIDWEYATEVRRDWETFKVMQVALGLTDEYLDELFTKGVLL